MFRLRFVLLTTIALPLAPVTAQEVPPLPAVTPTPEPSPTPVVPVPVPSPTPAIEEVPLVLPPPRAIDTPQPTPTSDVAARPTPAPTLTATPTPAPVLSSPTPTSPVDRPVIASPLPAGDDRGANDRGAWPWMLGAGLLLVGGIGVWLARRQRASDDEEIGPTPAEQERGTAATSAPAAVPAAPLPRLALRFRPTRVGFNMLSATAEGELTIANEGGVSLADIRVRTGLLGAHAGQDADLAEFLSAPIGRPLVPAFALAPGEERTLRVVAAVPREAMRTLAAAGRPIFVPVLVADVRVADGAQVAQGFAIGAERVDSARLAPFWLDVPDRGYTAIAAREHGPAVVRRG